MPEILATGSAADNVGFAPRRRVPLLTLTTARLRDGGLRIVPSMSGDGPAH
jgi:hypothetical protein